IDKCFAYADALRDRGIDARVVVEAVDREEMEEIGIEVMEQMEMEEMEMEGMEKMEMEIEMEIMV
ncbi:hypothetical protein Tco_0462449, partial [Tanacetum coccineum]